MPVISVNWVLAKKRIIGKMRAKKEERHKWSLTPKKFYNQCKSVIPFPVFT
jgi:hypothetical protein